MRFSSLEKGIVVGADKSVEWLLAWWWEHYSLYNSYPVLFCDFGMSLAQKKWCAKRGEVAALASEGMIPLPKEMVLAEEAQKWEAAYSPDVWKSRTAWFKKPLACLKSPFDVSLWLDIDCEVCGPLEPLFESFEPSAEIALAREISQPDELFNSGVILFRKNASILQKWLEASFSRSGEFMGDQELLSKIIQEERVAIQELPYFYNWRMVFGFHPMALIVHWAGAWGKEHLKKFGGVHRLMQRSTKR